MIDISMLSKKQNKNQNTSWISLCGKLEAYIGNYFLSGASIPDNKIETLYYDASIDKDDSVELIERNIVAYYMADESIAFVKKEIAQKTNVSIMTTGTILNDFLSKGIIVENELIYVEKGRPTHQYKLNPDYYHECMMYVKKNDCCSIIYCLKNALGELIYSKKIKKKEMVGEDIVNCLNKIIEEDKYLQYISLGLPAIISNNQVNE